KEHPMSSRLKPKVIAGTVAGLAVAGGGAAYAATQLGSPQQENQAVLNDAAKQLGVEPSALSAALKKALEKRVDEAVAAGRLTKIDAAVAAGRLTQSQADSILAGLKSHVTDFVNRTPPRFGLRNGFQGGGFRGGPPPGAGLDGTGL